MTRLSVDDYKAGWLTALYVEFSAAIAMLDSQHETPRDYKSRTETPNHYTFGEINGINVVVTSLPDGVYGNISATRVATDFSNDFPNLGLRFLVGIAGGAPKESNDVRLGDVVVSRPSGSSPGVIKHDSGKSLDSGFKLTGVLSKPPEVLLRALPLVRRWPEETLSAAIFQILANAFEKENQEMLRPPVEEDVLFRCEYHHPGEESSPCSASCSPVFRVDREPRSSWLDIKKKVGVPLDYLQWGRDDNDICISTPPPRIHYGTIASGDTLLRSGIARDRIQGQTGALCFEMEAAGVMDVWPCLVVRGICDYSHKNKVWQGYAAGTAAAFTKFLLMSIPHPRETRPPPKSLGTVRAGTLRPDEEKDAADAELALWRANADYKHSTSAYPQTHTPRARERELLPLTNSVTTADGTKIRQYGDAIIQGRSMVNGQQTYETEDFMDFSSKEGKFFNGSQKFKAKGPMRF
ncbi:hypothetical protein TWF106_007146 [Orbilia oligospora]|uniref:Uncharacterized protein n=1 Tax=Orbilia oligospora TaxID=2813651 RepID=A0A7C8QMD9_ORBOL|nr:hypothetical protein TWF106_007146 [Orbilia oligospora]